MWSSLPSDALQAVTAWAAVGIAGAIVALVVPPVRRWFSEKHLAIPLIASFVISGFTAATVGLFLRHLTYHELKSLKQASFSLLVAGTVDGNGTLSEQHGSYKFKITKKPESAGLYEVEFKDKNNKTAPLPEIPTILVGTMKNNADAVARVAVTHSASFLVQTSKKDVATDSDFWLVVFEAGSSEADQDSSQYTEQEMDRRDE
jgi:hypothetical protein